MSDSGFKVGNAVYYGAPRPDQPPPGELPPDSNKNLKAVKFPQPYKDGAPDVIVGVTSLVMSTKEEFKFETDADNISNEGFELSIDTWGDTIIHEAAVMWLSIDPDDPELLCGGFEFTAPPKDAQHGVKEEIVFPYKFRKVPNVLVWFTGFDTDFPNIFDVGVHCQAIDITQNSFYLRPYFGITGGVPRIDALYCNWLAMSPDKKNAACGKFDPQPEDEYYSSKTGIVEFPPSKFSKVPQVVLALEGVLRTLNRWGSRKVWGFTYKVTNVTTAYFEWSFEGADQTEFRGAELNWVAFT